MAKVHFIIHLSTWLGLLLIILALTVSPGGSNRICVRYRLVVVLYRLSPRHHTGLVAWPKTRSVAWLPSAWHLPGAEIPICMVTWPLDTRIRHSPKAMALSIMCLKPGGLRMTSESEFCADYENWFLNCCRCWWGFFGFFWWKMRCCAFFSPKNVKKPFFILSYRNNTTTCACLVLKWSPSLCGHW